MATAVQDRAQRADKQQSSDVNVGTAERIASVIGGGALALFGLYRRGVLGGVAGLVSADLLYRGLTGRCAIRKRLRMSSAGTRRSPDAAIAHQRGIHVHRTITVNRPPEELYRYWRELGNLPRFMLHLESVTSGRDARSHWVAKAPAGRTVEWDAEIITDRPNELIGWRSLEGADIPNAGSVRFTPAPEGRGTEVRVELEYDPPAGRLGAAVARIFGEEPQQQVRDDLARFKQVMEAGEIATTQGQPAAR